MLKLSANPLLRGPAAAAAVAATRTRRPRRPEIPLKTAHLIRRRETRRDLQHMLHVANAARELGRLPDREETIHAVMRGNFHGWDLVPAVLRLAAPATIETLYVATLGFNKQNAAELLELLDAGRIRAVAFLCSCYFRDSCPDEFRMLAQGLQERGHPIVAARTHAKVQLCGTTDGRRFVVESSANLRSCRNIEQFCMTESPPLFEFHQQWMDEVIAAAQREPAR